MLQTYACRNCGRIYSSKEFEESRFCLNCETYLLPESKVKKLTRKNQKVAKPIQGTSNINWLPNGYEPREGQMKFIEQVSKAINDNHIFFGNAPCGIGKSLASILAVLPHIEKNKLFITFRTRSQLDIYLKELKAVGCNLPIVSLSSKQGMCPLKIGGQLSYYDFFEQCKKLKENCKPLKKPHCRFYMKNLRKGKEAKELALDCASRFLTPSEASRFFVKRGFCAYEALRNILSKTRIFLGTYHYIFDPKIRGLILKDFNVDLDDVYIIVDEGHNIPTFARELLSDKISDITLDRALRETERFANDDIMSIRELLEVLDEQVFQHCRKVLKQKELKRIQPRNVDDLFLTHCGITGGKAAKTLIEYGEYVKGKREELGQENLLSYNYRVGEFLGGFFEKRGERYIHLVSKDKWRGIVLEVRGFDGREITSPVLKKSKGCVLMSGSLFPPQIYRDLILYDSSNVSIEDFNSPFPAENRLILSATDVSSRFGLRTMEMFDKWRQYIEAISKSNRGNVAFFFTSYDLLQTTLRLVEIDRKLLVEQRNTSRNRVLIDLKRSTNNALFGVMGGKFSEGIDYPGNVLTCVVAIGLPYATWNTYQKGLIEYYDNQFPEQGELYAYLSPAVLRLIQTSGRVHRSPEDKGCIVLLDERVTKPGIKNQLPRYFQKEMRIVKNMVECAKKIKEFWESHHLV